MAAPAEDVLRIVEFLRDSAPAPPGLSDAWPAGTDDLLENIFSLEEDSLNLLDQPLPDLGIYDHLSQPAGGGTDVSGSSCSDSGLSSDHADLMDYDQQLSPFLIQNTCSDDQVSQLLSPEYSSSGSSPLDTQLDSEWRNPEITEVTEEKIDLTQPEKTPAPRVAFKDVFHNTHGRKRRSSHAPNMAVVQPKIQKSAPIRNVNITPKPQLVVTPQRPLKVTNIQVMNQQTRVISKPVESVAQRKVIRVAPMAGNPRSILLPVTFKDMKDLRSIKIINAADFKNVSNIKLAAANLLTQSKIQESMNAADLEYDSNNATMDDSLSEQSDDEDDYPTSEAVRRSNNSHPYPRLSLTPEERKLLSKEGIKLPASYPLTKHEERELKRIRRKIRNKISAQDSRKRKKEYVDGLEDRVKQCSAENQTLIKRIKILQSQNQSLTAQLKRLQHVLSGGGGGKSAQPATCLLVLLMSVALVALPSMREADPAAPHAPGAPTAPSAPAGGAAQPALRRALLSATHNKALTDEIVLDDGEFNMEELITFKPHSDHDYQLSKRSPAPPHLPGGYLDIPIDEDWPPNLKHRIKTHFDYDDGQDYLPPIVKNENYQHFDTKINLLDKQSDYLTMGNYMEKLKEFSPMIAVKNEDIITEEITDHLDRNVTELRSFVVNGSATNM